jgi:hypothetical protein
MTSGGGTERRRHLRKLYSNVIKFCVNSPSRNSSFAGVMIDISDSGMCLYTSHELHKGEEILIQEKLPVKYRKATVVWVKNYYREFYRVGLTFHE